MNAITLVDFLQGQIFDIEVRIEVLVDESKKHVDTCLCIACLERSHEASRLNGRLTQLKIIARAIKMGRIGAVGSLENDTTVTMT